jgi:hypothetical protein
MTGTSIICPQCQATLRLPPAIPAGLKPKCPRCGTLVPAAAAMGRPLPPSSGNNGAAVQSPPQVRQIDPFVTIGIILSGAFLLVLLTAILLIICLQGDDSKTETAKLESVEEEIPIESPPAPISLPTPPQKPPPNNSFIELTRTEQRNVESTIQRGVDFLKSKQIRQGARSGSWVDPMMMADVGYTSLVGLTLLESNVTASDPAVQGAAKYVREHVKQPFGGNETYQVAVAVLFLSRLDEKADAPLIRSLALRLVASQHSSGGWLYQSPPLNSQEESQLFSYLQGFILPGGNPSAIPYVGVGHQDGGKDFADNSNTQFALLALWSARRYEAPVDPVLRLVAKRFRDTQRDDGSWNYQQNRVVSEYPTMTAAGLLGLAVGYGLDSERKRGGNMASDETLQKGLDRLAQGIGTPGASGSVPPAVETYFLWSVERVGVLYQLAKISGKDWYHWGMEILLHHQNQTDGSWHMGVGHGASTIVDTCFALLFLQRANLVKDLTDKLQELTHALRQMRPKD